ncbi:hypothetical protein DJ021_01915 [Phenylobacterium hankyongense]|uniref:Uncharacterized protein n=1 Tax=Phenylobacterium hankyongense TaxID=1813876 RepID=A0A328B0U7_9CAUL|nr:hypothetical protein [Phenylobacterium hankyongense]MDB5449309.1 hypothetical protein [Phenylobacterium sp.]MDB5467134.1 hypothetical protein [Phenylobacterium sp.]RAK58638.1 hypothetical protein DJ021_01915 [Phenylobacterium hankyongense]
MKPPPSKTRFSDLKGSGGQSSGSKSTFAPPTPMVSRQKRAKVLTAAERAAFLASRPDLKKP